MVSLSSWYNLKNFVLCAVQPLDMTISYLMLEQLSLSQWGKFESNLCQGKIKLVQVSGEFELTEFELAYSPRGGTPDFKGRG